MLIRILEHQISPELSVSELHLPALPWPGEMAFARAISNRIFYMDEGEIYEDDTPDDIFDAPKREKTRRFVQKLKVFEFTVESHELEIRGAAPA